MYLFLWTNTFKQNLTVCFAVLEHVDQPRVLHLYDGLHVFGDKLSLHHLHDGLLGGLVQAVHHSLDLFVYPSLHFFDVDAGAVLCQELLTLHLHTQEKRL